MHYNGTFYQSVLGYYCTKCDLVDRGAYNKRQKGIQKADDKVDSVLH